MSENSMEGALAPFLTFAKIFGILPYLNNVGLGYKLYVIYSLSINIFLLYVSLHVLQYLILDLMINERNDQLAELATIRTVQIITTTFVLLTSISIINYVLRSGHKLTKIIKNIERICSELKCEEMFYKAMKRHGRQYAFTVLPLLLLNSVRDVILWRAILVRQMEAKDFSMEGSIVMRVMHFVVECQLLVFVLAQKNLLCVVNSEIKKLKDLSPSGCNASCALKRLEQLRCSHFSLCELTAAINGVFQSVILFNTTLLFIDSLNGLYFGCISFINLTGMFTEHRLIVSANSIIWGATYYARLVHMTWICHAAYLEIETTRCVVQKMEFSIQIPAVQEELRTFRDQLAHTGTRFSVLGIFSLDSTLLHSVNNALATYLVILLQFHTLHNST